MERPGRISTLREFVREKLLNRLVDVAAPSGARVKEP